MSEEAVERAPEPDVSVRVAAAVHRELLTIQYQRRMRREPSSLSDVIEHLLQVHAGWLAEARGRT